MNLAELKIHSGGDTIQANYNKFSDHIRRVTPHGIQCSIFCGGLNCKYENPENWTPDSLAIQGIYSHWITDNILAMARPSTMIIIQKNVIQQFKSLGIKSIINLQCRKEHSSCGQPLEDSEFSYDPNVFMEQNIYYYNFSWKDYGDATLDNLLNMIKVIDFAITEGKVAIHCHAGLGRTGVLIACYLVYSLKVSANDAIRYVRLKRPGSVQTRGQILCVRHFAQFILPQTITFYIKETAAKDKHMTAFTLRKYLKRQRIVLHGYEARRFKDLPKIVYVICERILKLCACNDDMDDREYDVSLTKNYLTEKLSNVCKRQNSTYSIASITSPTLETVFSNCLSETPTPSSPNTSINNDHISDSLSEISTLDGDELSEENLLETRCFQELETQKMFNQEHVEDEQVVYHVHDVINALVGDSVNSNSESRRKIRQYQNELNFTTIGWLRLSHETDLKILANLLFEWLEELKEPIIKLEHFENIVILYKQPEDCFKKFTLEESYLIEYLLIFLSKLQPISQEDLQNLLKRFISSLSKQTVTLRGRLAPSGKSFKRIGEGTLSCTLTFMESLLEIVQSHHRQNNDDVKFCEKYCDEIEQDFE
ncbi:protein tyrosine phosphatase domain-containing protein 1-like [Anthonomus grandis grandis]|uniref:protein tyrosine phosphatase domain-containing protein 1-like n=1 Tax=Anthonomus grandis grandis TaxID=2921223 RepID=UPI0021655551|nr:protein tyrosine phosphatase domain-containing protein 1-like [Anthonomus grandis grandis]